MRSLRSGIRSILPPGPAGLASASILVGALGFHVVFIARSGFQADGRLTFSLFDDAMVSLTYARTFAAGDGLVWMAGEPPVEGYTNFLWTIVMTLPHLIGLPDRLTALPIMALGALLLSATSLLAMQIARRLSRQSFTAPLAVAATAFSYPLLFWTLRGLEVGLLAFLVMSACLLALRLADRPSSSKDRWLLCSALAAAVLTRTDAAVFVAVILCFLALSSSEARRAAFVAGLATAGALAAHTAFRLAYYGAYLPNTYYLKIAGHPLSVRLERGFEALLDLLANGLWAPVGLALVLLAVKRSSVGRPELLLVAIVLASMAYSVYVGGDAWEWARLANRYVSVALPALSILAVLGIEAALKARLERSVQMQLVVATIAVLLLLSFANLRSFQGWVRGGGLHAREDQAMVRQALAIRAASAPHVRVAVVWSGAIPYFSRRPSIDLLGKSDPVIARRTPHWPFFPGHDKWDYEYSVGQLRPDLVVKLWRATPRDQRLLERWGYERVGDYYVRSGAELDRLELLSPQSPDRAR